MAEVGTSASETRFIDDASDEEVLDAVGAEWTRPYVIANRLGRAGIETSGGSLGGRLKKLRRKGLVEYGYNYRTGGGPRAWRRVSEVEQPEPPTMEDVLRQGDAVVRAIDQVVPERTAGMHPSLLHLYDVAQSWRNFREAIEAADAR